MRAVLQAIVHPMCVTDAEKQMRWRPHSMTGGPSGVVGRRQEDAPDEGLDVTFDSYPYPLSSTRLLILIPQWAHDGGPERLKAVLGDQRMRERLRKDMAPRAAAWSDMWLTNFRHAHHHRFEGRSIAQVADMMDKDPVDVICELLVAENLGVSYVSAGGNAALCRGRAST